ncbi:MAG: TPM domain-containing protein [Gammaproteobacteria bacterium]
MKPFKLNFLVVALPIAVAACMNAAESQAQRRASGPDYSDVYVNDHAGLLGVDSEARVRDLLVELYYRLGVEMTVLSIDSINDYGRHDSIETFATEVFNRWEVGNAARNDGVLIVVAGDDRNMHIELGAGYSSAMDDKMQAAIDDVFLPSFRRDDYQDGIERGVAEVIYAVTGTYPGEYDPGLLQRLWGGAKRFLAGIHWAVYALLIVPLAWGANRYRRHLRYRSRACTKCSRAMRILAEEHDDAHLAGGQRLEEYLKSVNYDVWQCPYCQHMLIVGHRSWFSRARVCSSCGYRTLRTETTVVQPATASSSGTKRLDYSCQNCRYKSSETRTIAKKAASSSSGPSRSSFGGGRSSGGGASGRW